MADEASKPQATGPQPTGQAPEGGEAVHDGTPTPRSGGSPAWRELWQLPLLVVAVTGLAAGVYKAATSRPKPDVTAPLSRAERLIADDKPVEAVDVLNGEVFPFVDAGTVGAGERKAYHVLVARAIYLGQQRLGVSLEENNESIVREYLEAEKLGEKLEARDAAFLADALISVGRVEEGRARADKLIEKDPGRRRQLYRRMIERSLAGPAPDVIRARDLLGSMLAEATLPPEDRAWGTARQAELMLAQGNAEGVVDWLVRALPRMGGTQDREVAELHVLLGRAYLEIGVQDEAVRSLARAGEMLSAGDPLRGELLALEAEGEMRLGNAQEAREKFHEVTESYSASRTYLPALLGLGESEAILGRFEESLAAYEALVEALTRGETSGLVRADEVKTSLLRQHAVLMAGTPDRGGAPDPEFALRFASEAERLYPVNEVPAEVLDAIARSHRLMAEDLLPKREDSPDPAMEVAAMDPVTRDQARTHLRRAGFYAKLHTSRVSGDAQAYADSLWRAADAFDLAGDRDEAVSALLEFTESFPSDGRHAEARFRLGIAYQARGEYDRAADVFRSLIADRALRDVGVRVGPYADASHVPLAQCLLLDANAENDAEAESILEEVVEGSIVGTRSGVYADALSELAGQYERTGRWPRAIERFVEALERYPEDPRADLWRFRLADSCRRDAERIRGVLKGAMPDADRVELEQTRRERLGEALAQFERSVAGIGSKEPRRRRALESLYLRNAMFYMGDCAFDLGDYDEAVRLYEIAKERYPNDPASLVAMVQVVNAYVERGDFERARTANERARRFYESLPESVWDDPNLPMTRRDWERWLEASARLYALEEERGRRDE